MILPWYIMFVLVLDTITIWSKSRSALIRLQNIIEKKLWSAIKNKNKGERKTTPTTCFLIVLWTVYPLKCWSLELEYHHVRATYWVCVIGRVLIVFSVSHSPAMSYFYYSVCIYNLVNRLRARNRNRPLTSALHVGIFMNSDL